MHPCMHALGRYSHKIIHEINTISASVLDVAFLDARDLFITVAQDKVIKLWDVRTFTCIQTLVTRPSLLCSADLGAWSHVAV